MQSKRHGNCGFFPWISIYNTMVIEICLIVSVINMKGGIGKTTLSVNLATGLAKLHNKRVLLVDLDPQFNATQYLVSPKEYLGFISNRSNCTILDIFVDRPSESVGLGTTAVHKEEPVEPNLSNCTMNIYKNGKGRLDLVPSRLELLEADLMTALGMEGRLKHFLSKIESSYDFILLDCPPTIGLFTVSAYVASNAYLIPVKPDYLSSIGLSLISKAFKRLSKNYPNPIKFLGVVFLMIDHRTNLMKKQMKIMRNDESLKCFNSYLSHSTHIAETVEDNRSIFDLAMDHNRYANEMENIVNEFLSRVTS